MSDIQIANRLDNRVKEEHLSILRFILEDGYELHDGYSLSGGEKTYDHYLFDLDLWKYLIPEGMVERDHRPYEIMVVSKKGQKLLGYIEQQRTLMEQQNPVIALA